MHAYRREKFNHHANYTTERKNDIQATDAWKSGTIDNLESAVLWQPSWSKQKMLNRNINSLKYGLLWQKRPNKTPLQRGLYGGSLSTGLLKFGGTEQQYEMPVVVSMEWGDTHKIFAAKSMQCHPTSTSRNSAKKASFNIYARRTNIDMLNNDAVFLILPWKVSRLKKNRT